MAKKSKKIEKDLAESNKCDTFAQKMSKMTFKTEFNFVPVFEKVSPDPVDNLVPNEALSIREILVRSSRGQRVKTNVRYRSEGIPDNMYSEAEVEKHHETIEMTPPDDINDIVDVMRLKDENDQRKAAYEARKKKEDPKANTEVNKDKPDDPGVANPSKQPTANE